MEKTKLYVEIFNKRISDYRKDEEYGDWEETNQFFPIAVKLNNNSYYEEFEAIGKIEYADDVWVLWFTYTTGDSFGNSSGNGEIVWVFTDEMTGWKALNNYKKNIKSGSIEFFIENGEKVRFNNPASGYFENLEDIHLTRFVVDKD